MAKMLMRVNLVRFIDSLTPQKLQKSFKKSGAVHFRATQMPFLLSRTSVYST
jgi:hypothetical protein